ncbi:HK97 gp10 family phage protein [Oceanobacillus sp. E9]|uniref:HK97 gp10 family phage protein n=1 Tax=Oceanobacillus sp. E9 TaxID=1742575 RepID=UPI000B2A079C|nr:HK97 gp10 family phage protein [Oceanobacillus sp. E9]
MIDISKEIVDALKEFTTEVEEGLEKSQKEVAQDTAQDLKGTSPKRRPKYSKGWKAKKTRNGWVVHNATSPQLTHLLENGHAKRGGGRVGAQPHIYPAEQSAIKMYEDLVEKVIRG